MSVVHEGDQLVNVARHESEHRVDWYLRWQFQWECTPRNRLPDSHGIGMKYVILNTPIRSAYDCLFLSTWSIWWYADARYWHEIRIRFERSSCIQANVWWGGIRLDLVLYQSSDHIHHFRQSLQFMVETKNANHRAPAHWYCVQAERGTHGT